MEGTKSPAGCNFNFTAIQGIAIVILFLQVTELGGMEELTQQVDNRARV